MFYRAAAIKGTQSNHGAKTKHANQHKKRGRANTTMEGGKLIKIR